MSQIVLKRLALVMCLALLPCSPANAKVVDKGSDAKGKTNGSYRIEQNGNKVTVTLHMKARVGRHGTTHGALTFLLLDANRNIVWKKGKTLAVGARPLHRSTSKSYDETMTIVGPPANGLIKKGFTAFFDITGRTSGGLLPHNFADLASKLGTNIKAVNKVVDSLSPGQKAALSGAVFSQVGPVAPL